MKKIVDKQRHSNEQEFIKQTIFYQTLEEINDKESFCEFIKCENSKKETIEIVFDSQFFSCI